MTMTVNVNAELAVKVMEALAPAECSVQGLVDRVAQQRGRPIELRAFPMPDVVQYGVWMAGATRDYIFYDEQTARVHQEHIILHELAHMLLGHQTVLVDQNTDLSQAFLMRAVSNLADTARERAAEGLAAALQDELVNRAGLDALTGSASTTPLWSRMITDMGLDA